jgi:hypothetical protein
VAQLSTLGITTHHTNNAKQKMKTKHIHQRFISGLLAVLSIASLAMLLLARFVRPSALDSAALASYFQSGKTPLLDLYARFAGGGSNWLATSLSECLAVSLILIVAFSLFSLRLARRSGDSK